MNFTSLEIIPSIRHALTDVDYSSATEIQSKAIPPILEGRDVIGCAQTGTGKTGAFAIPILQKLQDNSKHTHIHTLILTPTRELAIQIEDSFNLYSKYLKTKTLAIFGGVPQGRQVTALKKGIDILVATPGRLMDLMQQQVVSLAHLEIIVLDEADRMLDMGFINDIKRILKKVPQQRQTLLFSATMPKAIRKFSHSILKNPVEIAINIVSSAADTVDQSVYLVERREKTTVLINLLRAHPRNRTLIFTRTKYGADKLVKKLRQRGIHAAAIHGNKSQNARQRALEDFKRFKISVLVATDIASRGIDIEDLSLVVNYDLPHVSETYVHRIGRTGRAGRVGKAISFCDEEQRDDLKAIQKLIGFKIPLKKMEVRSKRELITQ